MSATPPSSTKRHIAVIGAGLSGLSAAIMLLNHGHQVTVYEAAPHAGGRARSVKHPHTMLDNGQHLCIGAYHATLALLEEAGVDIEDAFLRLPLTLAMYDGTTKMLLRTPQWLPAPLHLLVGLCTARGLGVSSKWQAIRWMSTLRLRQFKLAEDCTVSQLLAQGKQTTESIRRLWAPLCLAALNTPPDTASAQVFLNVLRDSLMQQRSDSDFLIARHDMTTTLIAPLLDHMHKLGGTLHLHCPVKAITTDSSTPVILTEEAQQQYDHIIVATGPHQRKHISGLPYSQPEPAYQPITTVYIQFDAKLQLPFPLIGLCHGQAQWVFDRGLCCGQPGLMAVVISAHPLISDKQQLVNACIAEINTALSSHGRQLPTKPIWWKVITEKRATFRCDAHMLRPEGHSASTHIWITGDDVDNGYPATIEGAILNGIQVCNVAGLLTTTPASSSHQLQL